MLESRKIKALLSIVFLAVILLAGGCRNISKAPDRDRLVTRVQGYIEARNAMKLKTLASFYLEPERARLGNIRFLKGEIGDISIDGENAEVTLKNTFMVMGFTFKKVPQKTEWVWHKGDWYLVVPKSTSPFGNHSQKEAGKKR
jgi:hypothetical protein